jgi:hypothetical protein
MPRAGALPLAHLASWTTASQVDAFSTSTRPLGYFYSYLDIQRILTCFLCHARNQQLPGVKYVPSPVDQQQGEHELQVSCLFDALLEAVRIAREHRALMIQ